MFPLRRARLLGLPFVGIAVLFLSFFSTAQTSRVAGAIQGTVDDQTGSAVVGAKVTLRKQRTNQTRTIFAHAETCLGRWMPGVLM